MSKFFNETQKAHQWAQQRLSKQGLDLKEMVESVRGGATPQPSAAEVCLSRCRQVLIGNTTAVHLVLRQDDSSRAAWEAYRGLRTKVMRAQAKTGLKSIAVTSSLPGEGKTLTTMNLGLCYGQLPQQRVLVIDADLRSCGLTALLEHPSTPGLGEVLGENVPLEEAIVGTDQKNLFVLPGGKVSTPPPEPFTGSRWQELISRCGELFSLVLIDTPPMLPLADFELISAACDGVVMVVRARHADRAKLQKTAAAVDRKKLLGFVLNGTNVNENSEYPYKYAE